MLKINNKRVNYKFIYFHNFIINLFIYFQHSLFIIIIRYISSLFGKNLPQIKDNYIHFNI